MVIWVSQLVISIGGLLSVNVRAVNPSPAVALHRSYLNDSTSDGQLEKIREKTVHDMLPQFKEPISTYDIFRDLFQSQEGFDHVVFICNKKSCEEKEEIFKLAQPKNLKMALQRLFFKPEHYDYRVENKKPQDKNRICEKLAVSLTVRDQSWPFAADILFNLAMAGDNQDASASVLTSACSLYREAGWKYEVDNRYPWAVGAYMHSMHAQLKSFFANLEGGSVDIDKIASQIGQSLFESLVRPVLNRINSTSHQCLHTASCDECRKCFRDVGTVFEQFAQDALYTAKPLLAQWFYTHEALYREKQGDSLLAIQAICDAMEVCLSPDIEWHEQDYAIEKMLNALSNFEKLWANYPHLHSEWTVDDQNKHERRTQTLIDRGHILYSEGDVRHSGQSFYIAGLLKELSGKNVEALILHNASVEAFKEMLDDQEDYVKDDPWTQELISLAEQKMDKLQPSGCLNQPEVPEYLESEAEFYLAANRPIVAGICMFLQGESHQQLNEYQESASAIGLIKEAYVTDHRMTEADSSERSNIFRRVHEMWAWDMATKCRFANRHKLSDMLKETEDFLNSWESQFLTLASKHLFHNWAQTVPDKYKDECVLEEQVAQVTNSNETENGQVENDNRHVLPMDLVYQHTSRRSE